MNTTPEFYKSIANNPTLEAVGTQLIGSTILPIIGSSPYKGIGDFATSGEFFVTIPHDLNGIYDALVRVKKQGTNIWYTLPKKGDLVTLIITGFDVWNITENNIVIRFGVLEAGKYDIEVYFLDFKF